MGPAGSQASCFASMRAVVSDSFGAVHLAQSIVIQNRRLGFCSKLLQATAILVIAVIIVIPSAWLEDHRPEAANLIVWAEFASKEAYQNEDVKHCKNTSAYSFQWSPSWWYRPSECRSLPNRLRSQKRGTDVFLPTYISEKIFWTGECSDNNRDACSIGHQGSRGEYSEGAGLCMCTIHYEYLVKNAEETSILFLFGFHVRLEDGKSAEGTLDKDFHLVKTPSAADTKIKGKMVTRLRKPDGSLCMVMNRSEYSLEVAGEGIGGKLKDLLACAGMTLDSDPRPLDTAIGKSTDNLRLMGMNLKFELAFNYPSADADGLATDVTVSVLPVWNSEKEIVTYSEFGAFRNGSVEIEQFMYGVTPIFTSAGHYRRFNIYALLSALVNATVILSLPGIVTTFLALYCVGSSSAVFRTAVKQPFSIYRSMHDSFMKMFVANAAFRFLTDSGSKNSADEIKGLSGDEVYNFILDVFRQEVSSGGVNVDEVSAIVSFLMKESTTSFDDQDSGSDDKVRRITFPDFLAASLRNEPVPVASLLDFLDVHRRRSCLELLFDDTDFRIKDAAKTVFFQGFDQVQASQRLERLEEAKPSSELPDFAMEYLSSLEEGKHA
eukprot:TRINITY_DN105469_c0_g1_i1.p1 TRINITY_DN105469_c0_g1~~TRINITY_DN105469_c0_g1_i1.p1  ORF type:complete len:606 (+),score=87.71 TRINITY_DN105469_c0_g1_i1:53-1870(+)